MNNWPSKPLKDLCDPNRAIAYGIVQPGKPFPGGIPIVRVNNFGGSGLNLSEVLSVDPAIEKQYIRSRPQPSDVLVTLVGSIGQVAIAPAEIAGWNLARAVGLLPMPDHHHAQWVAYSIRNRDAQEFIRQRANTTVQATFNLGDLAKLPIPYPDKPVRQGILETLTAIDDRIELNRRMNETLEGMAQAIFRDWFVDFGPVRRKAAGEADPVAIMGGLTPDPARVAELAALFPASLGDDGLPVGWKETAIGDLVKAQGGSTPSTGDEALWAPAKHYWATPKDLSNMNDLALFDTARQISDAGLAKITSGLLPVGSVLLSSRAPIGYLAIAQVQVAINQGFIGLAPSAEVGSAYLYCWCKANMDKIVANANGSTFQEISKKNFRPITSALPADRQIIAEFGKVAEPLFARLIAGANENRALAETRDYLLPRLMSGAVHVKPIELGEG